MISLAFIVLFFFCIAAAVFAALLSYRLITTYSEPFQRYYFYYLVSFYAFAVYGLWGQIILRQLMIQLNMAEAMIERVTSFLPMLGIPFLFISWILLLNTAYALFDRKVPSLWVIAHTFLFVVIVAGSWFGYTIDLNSENLLAVDQKYFLLFVLSIVELLYYTAFVIVVYRLAKEHSHELKRFAAFICLAMISRIGVAFIAYLGDWWLALALLIYFISNVFPLLYLSQHAESLFRPIRAEHTDKNRFDYVFNKYKITKREREIVKQICAGKTNQQIADELFISLQTVKDHTHRIYTKVGIKSRMQLVQMIST